MVNMRLALPPVPQRNTQEWYADELCYTFKRTLSLYDSQLLNQLHTVFCQQWRNASSFFQLSCLATKDSLTGLGNRRAFDEDARRLHGAAERHKTSFGLLVLDLDNFKQVNDNFGHDEGDRVIQAFASLLSKSMRTNDSAYRFGGDEFSCLIDVADNENLAIAGQRILDTVAMNDLLTRHHITASMGAAVLQPGQSVENLFKQADEALYCVKRAGKNSLAVA